MKKYVISLLVISMLLLSLAAFADTVQLPTYNGPAVTLTFWSWVPGISNSIAAFEKAYPNIKINYVNVGANFTEYNKLLTALSAGSGAPDVAQIEYQVLPTFISYGGLVDLTKYGINKYESLFVPWTWNQVKSGNGVYAVPQDTGPLALAYNKAIFAKYDLTVPTTWEEFEKDAQKLYQESNGTVYMTNFNAIGASNVNWLVGLIWAAGGQLWTSNGNNWVQTINSPIAKKVVSYWGNMVNKGYISSYEPFTSDWYNAMSNGKIASMISAAWLPLLLANNLSNQYAGQWQIVPLPYFAGEKSTSGNWGGSTDAVTVQSKYPEASMIFALWLNANPTSTTLDNENGGLFPAAITGLEDPTMHNTSTNTDKFFGGQDVNQAFFDASDIVNVNFAWAPWANYFFNSFANYMNEALSGKMTWDQAMDQLQSSTLNYAQTQGFNVK
ncbi:MAG: sugar ABC transporter substrate-binding protein [Thermotogae bacterium]|jgi:multiple sugar transport system substrate-binding protein|nr:sugar ABC transporter substrate-binding protein [Thermotogota bacterium]MCL5031822.1 sugar ABC transporter substrate-binding protein [Thermotogota bacterium]